MNGYEKLRQQLKRARDEQEELRSKVQSYLFEKDVEKKKEFEHWFLLHHHRFPYKDMELFNLLPKLTPWNGTEEYRYSWTTKIDPPTS